MTERVDSLQNGSWNGVPFLYLDAGWNPGLRGQLHEYPDRDQGYFEPLGKKTAQFTLDVFLVGDDWISQRQALATAFASGQGTLVHPLDGRMSAICIDVQIKETVTELGRVGMSVTFLPGNTPLPAATPDTGAAIDTAASTASSDSQTDFNDNFTETDQPYEVTVASQSALNGALSAIGDAVGFSTDVVGGAASWFNYAVSTAGEVERSVLNDVSSVTGINASVEQSVVSWAGDLASTAQSAALLGSYPALGQQLGALVSGISGLGATGSGAPFTSWAAQRRAGVARTVMKAAS